MGYDLLDIFQVTEKDVGVQNYNQLIFWQDTNRQKLVFNVHISILSDILFNNNNNNNKNKNNKNNIINQFENEFKIFYKCTNSLF